jgi:hypothetical protein
MMKRFSNIAPWKGNNIQNVGNSTRISGTDEILEPSPVDREYGHNMFTDVHLQTIVEHNSVLS